MKDDIILKWIREKEINSEKIEQLEKENKRLTKLISSNYYDYLKEQFAEPDEWYIQSVVWGCRNSYEFYHCGKFKYFSFLGEKDKKRLPNYGNDYEAHFEFIEGFTTNLNVIAKNNLSIDITDDDPHFEIDSEHQDGIVRLHWNGLLAVTKERYEKEKKAILKKIDDYSKATYGDYECGDKIEYANKRGIFTGEILMICGKSAYLVGGEKVNLSTPRVRKI